MKEKYIEEIRKACIKANPSILDLKFGCEVKIEEDKYLVISKQLDEKVFCLYENESYTRFFGEDIRSFFSLIDVVTNDMTDLQVVFDYIDLMPDVIWYYIHNEVQFEAVTKGARYSFSVENWFTLRDEANK